MSELTTSILFILVLILLWAVMLNVGWYREILKKGKYIKQSWLKQSQQETQQFKDNGSAAKEITAKKENLLQKWEDEKKEIQLKIDEALQEKNELIEKLAKSESVLKEKTN